MDANVNVESNHKRHQNISVSYGITFIIVFWILFTSFSFGANENEVIVKCREAIFQLESSPPYVVATLFDGTVQVFDTSGRVIYDVDLDLAIPSIEYLNSLRKDTTAFLEGDYDYTIFFPESERLVVIRDRYSQSQSVVWQRMKNLLMYTLGMGSRIEVWAARTRIAVFKIDVNGFLIPKHIDLNNNVLAYVASEAASSGVYIADIDKQEILMVKGVSIFVEGISLFDEQLYFLTYEMLTIYDLDQNSGLIRKDSIEIGCNLYQHFVFDQRSAATRELWVFNSCLDSTIGRIRFIGDSASFEESKNILNITPLGLERSNRPLGFLDSTEELVLPSFGDSIYLIDFDKKSIRTKLQSQIVDTSKYFLPFPITGKYFYSRMRITDYGDSTFAILRIDL